MFTGRFGTCPALLVTMALTAYFVQRAGPCTVWAALRVAGAFRRVTASPRRSFDCDCKRKKRASGGRGARWDVLVLGGMPVLVAGAHEQPQDVPEHQGHRREEL